MAEQRILIIGDALQSTSMTDRIFRDALPAEYAITSFEWDADQLGGISVASLQAERGAAFPIPAAWGQALQRCTVLVTHFYPVRADVLNAAPRLTMIASLRHGLENVDVSLAARRGVRVANNPGRTAEAVSDLAVGAIIDQLRGYARSDRELRRGHWLQPLDVAPFAKDLRRTTVGVLGFGYVGRRVAHKLAAFGSELLVHDPLLPDGEIRAAGAEPVALADLLSRSDVVTVHVRLSDDTRHMLGATQLRLMKKSAYLINVARAELVDEAALVDALQTGTLAGAALDVFEEEPLPPDHALLRLDNVTLTPHIAGSTVNSEETTARNLVARVKAALSASATISE